MKAGVPQHVGMFPFVRLFPQQGTTETRTVTIRGHAALPDDEYGLIESYCLKAACHCRRVMLNVGGRRQQAILASISYAFDRDDEWPGPFLDPLNPQSRYADALLDLVAQILADPDYVARLEAHYYQFKGAMADPTHPGQRFLAGASEAGLARPPRLRARPRTQRRR